MDDYLLQKISDFGISKINDLDEVKLQSKTTATVKGTPIFITSEIWTSDEVNQFDRQIQPKNQSSTPRCKKINLSNCAIGIICFVSVLALILIIYFAVH